MRRHAHLRFDVALGGVTEHAPAWLKVGACSAAAVTMLSVALQVVPILDVAAPGVFAANVAGRVVLIMRSV